MNTISTNYAYLGDHRAVAMTSFNRRIILDTRNIQNYSIITHGVFEKGVAWAIEKHLKPGQTMLDIGANIGFFTLLGCHTVGPKGKVYSFEPNPDVFAMMEQSVHINAFRKRSVQHNVAAFDRVDEIELTWSPAKHGGGRLVTTDQVKLDECSAKIRALPVDDLVDEADLPVSLIKIDTEGSESYALHGAQRILERSPGCVVVTEWNPNFIQARGSSVPQLIDFLRQHFTGVERIVKVGKTEKLTFDALENLQHSNLILKS